MNELWYRIQTYLDQNLRGKPNLPELPFAPDIHAWNLYLYSQANYRLLAEIACPLFFNSIDEETGVFNSINTAQAVGEINNDDGIVIPVLVTAGADKPFALTGIADLYFDDDTKATPKQAILLQVNADCESVSGRLQGLTAADASSFIVALAEAGKLARTYTEFPLLTKAEYISLRESEQE